MSCSITGWNSGESSLSASSITSMRAEDSLATPFAARSSSLPGVATTQWTGWCSRTMSSRSEVPPVVTITSAPRCFPSSRATCEVCSASSRVGTRITAWISLRLVSRRSRTGMQKAAVLPVPFLARARMSRPVSAIGIDSSWIGEGRSNPFS